MSTLYEERAAAKKLLVAHIRAVRIRERAVNDMYVKPRDRPAPPAALNMGAIFAYALRIVPEWLGHQAGLDRLMSDGRLRYSFHESPTPQWGNRLIYGRNEKQDTEDFVWTLMEATEEPKLLTEYLSLWLECYYRHLSLMSLIRRLPSPCPGAMTAHLPPPEGMAVRGYIASVHADMAQHSVSNPISVPHQFIEQVRARTSTGGQTILRINAHHALTRLKADHERMIQQIEEAEKAWKILNRSKTQLSASRGRVRRP